MMEAKASQEPNNPESAWYNLMKGHSIQALWNLNSFAGVHILVQHYDHLQIPFPT
jgi:N-acetyl-gamma-glutamylphosphate reductase